MTTTLRSLSIDNSVLVAVGLGAADDSPMDRPKVIFRFMPEVRVSKRQNLRFWQVKLSRNNAPQRALLATKKTNSV